MVGRILMATSHRAANEGGNQGVITSIGQKVPNLMPNACERGETRTRIG